jgi:6-phosphogluconolactonase
MPYFMYVSLQDDDKIATFAMAADTGKLTPKGETPVAGGPSSMAISPDRQVLYASHRNSMEISSYLIDRNTGGLTQNGKVSVQAAPTFIATDRRGKFLLSSYYQGAHAAVHPLGDDGSVGGDPIEWRETAIGAHAMQTDPSNRFAFVPHIDNRGGPNAIFQFKFDPDTGRITPNSPARVDQPRGTGPRHFCFHPHMDISTSLTSRAAA